MVRSTGFLRGYNAKFISVTNNPGNRALAVDRLP